ncbi:Phosphoribosylglycinamide formyltransferase [Chitinispirillum alkaliphilum]|nr:Phosphoribosylglycinamide formyltransferase [Chitinispirillum alkaliphilum]
MLRCAVFASGGGSNFKALLERSLTGDLHAQFVLMIGNNSTAAVFEHARKHHIPTLHCAPSHFDSEQQYSSFLIAQLEKCNAQMIVLAGYMKKLPTEIVEKYQGRIINIHPSLLPAFGGKGMYGSNVHKAVIECGVRVTGVTVHFVDEEYDQGPIISQEPVKVLDTDTPQTLAARVLAMEHATYWRALDAISRGKICLEGRRVKGNV